MMEFMRDLWDFLKSARRCGITHFIVLGLIGGLIVATQQSSIATLIYTLF